MVFFPERYCWKILQQAYIVDIKYALHILRLYYDEPNSYLISSAYKWCSWLCYLSMPQASRTFTPRPLVYFPPLFSLSHQMNKVIRLWKISAMLLLNVYKRWNNAIMPLLGNAKFLEWLNGSTWFDNLCERRPHMKLLVLFPDVFSMWPSGNHRLGNLYAATPMLESASLQVQLYFCPEGAQIEAAAWAAF